MQKLSITILCCLLSCGNLLAQSPALDGTFGANGRFSIYFDPDDLGALSRTYVTAVQPDGWIVAGGLVSSWDAGFLEYKVALTRMMPNGMLDTSFGEEGRVVLDDKYIRCCTELIVQPDGKILISGWGWGGFLVVRLLPDGTRDSTFGTNGIATIAIWTLPDDRDISSMHLLPNGKILLTGFRETGPDYGMMTLLKADGKQDFSFGNFGSVKFNANFVTATVQQDGKILLASSQTDQPANVKVERYDAQGDKDMAFGEVNSDQIYNPTELFALPDGKFIVLGTIWPEYTPAAIRFNADGSVDTSYGNNGLGLIEYGNQIPPYSGILQSDGKLIVFGGQQGWGFITRYKEDGTLDTGFGANGFILPETLYEVFYSGSLLPDGKIIAPTRFENNLMLQMGSVLRYIPTPFVGVIDAPVPLDTPLLYPNPIKSAEITVEYELPNASGVRIDLLDQHGILLECLMESERPADKHKECLSLPTTLLPGAYLLNIQTGAGNSVLRFVVVK